MKKRNAKLPTPEDRYAGERISEARIALGLSQAQLGELLGVSYQQVQKYENGSNRVNGARISLLLSALRRPFGFFFPNATDIRATTDPVISRMLTSKEGQRLANAFSHISSPVRRRRLLEQAEDYAAMEKTHD